MPHELARQLVLSATAHTPAFEVTTENSIIRVDVTALSQQSGSSVSLLTYLEGSDDLQNWTDLAGASSTVTTAPSVSFKEWTGFYSRYARVRFENTGATCVIAATAAQSKA